MNQVMQLLDEGLREGALGIGVGAAYMQRGMTSYEQFEAQRTAERYGRLASVHTRYHLNTQTPAEAPIALDEVLANAMLLRAPLLLAHDNDYGWWENEEKLQLAGKQGFNVWGEYYPFAAGSTLISADFLRPEVWEKVNGYKYEETIYDPGADKFLTKEEYLKLVKEKPGYFVVVHLPPRKKWLKYWLTIPEMVVASDAMQGADKDGKLLPWDADVTRYAGHPRTASTYSTTLQLGRENGVPLMFTLAQLSYWNAKHLGDTGLEAMKERGRVQVGKIADLTLFNPQTVKTNATYKAGENRPAADRHSLRNRARNHRCEGRQGAAGQARPADPLSGGGKGPLRARDRPQVARRVQHQRSGHASVRRDRRRTDVETGIVARGDGGFLRARLEIRGRNPTSSSIR